MHIKKITLALAGIALTACGANEHDTAEDLNVLPA